jgi:1,4-dihydroxy-2-naphthoate octaprenyltransferase
VFFILHFLLYPASNGYNSYFDKDEESIGGLKNPPPTTTGLYYLALLFDVIAIVLGYLTISLTFAVMLLIYGLVSKAYSHPSIRLKKHALISLLITGLFQGFFTLIMCYVGVNDFSIENSFRGPILIPAILSTLMLWANYPMTQIYQHAEDTRRGDITLSIRLGIHGTFYFAASVFGLAVTGFLFYFNIFFSEKIAWTFLLAIIPILLYFFYWFILVLKKRSSADYKHTMWLNYISGTCLNAFFIYLFLKSTQLLQLFQ